MSLDRDPNAEVYTDPVWYTIHETNPEPEEAPVTRRRKRRYLAEPEEAPTQSWGEVTLHLLFGSSQLSRFTQGVLIGMAIMTSFLI